LGRHMAKFSIEFLSTRSGDICHRKADGDQTNDYVSSTNICPEEPQTPYSE